MASKKDALLRDVLTKASSGKRSELVLDAGQNGFQQGSNDHMA
jgi:hypothetical protein